MLHLRCDFFSEILTLNTSMTVLLPQRLSSPPPVLYLLHGMKDDDTAWVRHTRIERYAESLGLAVVMPQVHRSYYSDMTNDGGRYWTFVAEELPELVQRSFVVSTRRADTFVAGLSMGGYGAIKLALRQPDRFAAAGAMSGAFDATALPRRGKAHVANHVWGPAGVPAEDDLHSLIASATPSALPKLWAVCGTDDGLITQQRDLVARLQAGGADITAEEHPGKHDWDFWDTHLQRFLAWLPLG